MRNMTLPTARLLMLTVLVTLFGCGRPETPRTASERNPKEYIVGVSLANLGDPWHEQMKADIETAAAKHPDLRLILLDAQNNVAQQVAQLEKLHNDRVDAVIVNPIKAQAMTKPVARLFDAGIPVMVLGRPVIGRKYTCFIAADPRQIGTVAGRWLAKRLAGKGTIVELLGPIDSLWDTHLHRAWQATLRNPGFHFVFDGHVDPPNVDAGELMAEAIDDVEAIDAVFAYNDTAALTAYEVAKNAGREKNVLFIGIGGLPTQGAAYVSQGILTATFLRPTGGTQAIETLVKLIDGQQAPKKITLPTHIITRSLDPAMQNPE